MDGSVPHALKLRVDHALAVYSRLSSEDGGTSLYVFGADVAGRGTLKPEGSVILELLQRHGVNLIDIDVDTEAFNAIENALNATAPLRRRCAEAVTLVTSSFYAPRAEYIFRTVFAAYGVKDVVFMLDPAPSALVDGPARPQRKRPKEINDWNFVERIEHEFSLMQERMVPWLLQYDCPSRQSDIDRALSCLRQLAEAGSVSPELRNTSSTHVSSGDLPREDNRSTLDKSCAEKCVTA